jgi:sugar fermentation stimulation protein A
MTYDNIHAATFVRRVNRFVAEVEIEGHVERVHVKNTGRCAELLVPGYSVVLEKSGNPARRTAYDLIGVDKPVPGGVRYVNMDSMAPNRAAGEWLAAGGLGTLEDIRAEVTVGDSRFDFVAAQHGRPVAVEVKGCTLEEGGVARFPDAPTLRGLKHVRGLTRLAGEGWRCVLLVVIQMKGVRVFTPNWETQPEFGEALIEAQRAGVEVLAVDCAARPGEVVIDAPVRVEMGRIRN